MTCKIFFIVTILFVANQDLYSQSKNNYELGLSMMITDVSIKDQLLTKEKILDTDAVRPGFEVNISRSLFKNIRFETGVQYFYNSIRTTAINSAFYTLLDLDENDLLHVDILDDNPLGVYATRASFLWDPSECDSVFGNEQSIYFYQRNKINFKTIGIPFRFEYLHGSNPFQLYFSASLTPSMHISKGVDIASGNKGIPYLHPGCEKNKVMFNPYTRIDHETEIVNFKVNDFFISTFLSAGLKHTRKQIAYKLGVVYGGNNINFSSADSDRVVKEILALKFGISWLL